jgi:3-phenylpropionate/trans-cinnamate dioxygenase ferredoxin subunit
VAELTVCPVEELPPGEVKIVRAGELAIGVYNPEGDFEPDEGVAICPRHGSRFDVRTGRPLTLPAYIPVDTFEVKVAGGFVKVIVP